MNRLFKKKGIEYNLDRNIEKKIKKWLKKNKFKKKSFGLILKELGFKLDKKVIFMKNVVDNGRISLFYWIDGDSSYDKNRMLTLLNPNGIELRDTNTLVSYECFYDKTYNSKIRLEKDQSKYWIEGKAVSYSRNIFYDKDGDTISIVVKYGKLDQCINIDVRYDSVFRTDFKIKNEKELMEYLMNLTFPLSIEEVYKRVREISFDVDLYSKIVVSNVGVKDNIFSKVEYLYDRNSETINVLDKDRKVSYRRVLNDSKVDMVIWFNDYKINFEVVCDWLDYRVKRLENDKELVEYLMNLTFPISMDKVYKDICKVSLGDVSKYSRIVFQCTELKSSRITDMIVLDDGYFDKFGMTKNGKTMFLDKDGSFRYQIFDAATGIDLCIDNDDKMKCEVSSNDGKSMDDYIETKLLTYDIGDARKEKEKIKRLVKRVFNNDSKDIN